MASETTETTLPLRLPDIFVAEQTIFVGQELPDTSLPEARGGTSPYTYTLTPLPAGITFTPATRVVSGSPTTVGVTNMVYTATDADGTEVAKNVRVEVVAAPSVSTNTPSVAETAEQAAQPQPDPFAAVVKSFDDARRSRKEARERLAQAVVAVANAEAEKDAAQAALDDTTDDAMTATEALETLLAKFKAQLGG